MLHNQTDLTSIPVQVPVVLPSEPAASPPCSIEASVLHVINGEYFSGAERVQSHLGRCLPHFGIAADFVCVKPGKFPQVIAEQDLQWGRCHLAPMKSRFDLRAVFRIRDLVRAYGYDLLHAHTPRTAMVASAASRLTGIPWVYHVHSPAARDSVHQWSNRINSWMERASLLSCSHLITVSESLRLDCIAKGANEDNVTVVHNGVPSIRPERIHHPVVGGRWVLGMVALMRPRKGLEVVLDALEILRADGLDVVLRCIGPFETAEYECEINEQIDRLKLRRYVERVGFTDDVPSELARVDALVLPSLFGEGLPMVVLEAMAAAVPVIATRVEGTPEAVTDGVEGLLAEPRNAVSLANKIRSLVTGEYDWNMMAEAAHERQTQSFSDLSMAWGTAEVYRKLIDAPELVRTPNHGDDARPTHVSQRDNFVIAGHRD
ncbi:glycosyl transferase, group 1 family protein [Rhodopirellula maiorica SM1]|uniref:Glycosyl transferase, group 1 family protein n=1 Tax=Rhodopirellula maiorica SM1 TaxID=1265738 RepID=M5RLR5_9BACT|nr:glycosyltransferase family 4 protein [Rhodopirellula maiorica]EMI20255.1 glycosyl transferase, group 1 family protein [Rhodopirellula maiorica SM1]